MPEYVVSVAKFDGHPMANPFMCHLVRTDDDLTAYPNHLGYLQLLRQMVEETADVAVGVDSQGNYIRVRDLEAARG